MQNKPNFRKAKMDVNIYYTELYENILCIPSQGKQTQTNPISNPTTKLKAVSLCKVVAGYKKFGYFMSQACLVLARPSRATAGG